MYHIHTMSDEATYPPVRHSPSIFIIPLNLHFRQTEPKSFSLTMYYYHLQTALVSYAKNSVIHSAFRLISNKRHHANNLPNSDQAVGRLVMGQMGHFLDGSHGS